MISLVKEIPKLTLPRPEVVKINSNYNSYKDVALFWVQDDTRAVISMLDGNMVIFNQNANVEELREFINVISPSSVFSDEQTLLELYGNTFHRVCVMKSEQQYTCNTPSDEIGSAQMYKLLDVEGLHLPSYEYFAVDFCHRFNHGHLKYYALDNLCAAIGISDGCTVMVNGIASHKKGMGSKALYGLLSLYNLPAIAVCEEKIMPFYIKNKFSLYYKAGYWRKHT
jgi:hypothetical protein